MIPINYIDDGLWYLSTGGGGYDFQGYNGGNGNVGDANPIDNGACLTGTPQIVNGVLTCVTPQPYEPQLNNNSGGDSQQLHNVNACRCQNKTLFDSQGNCYCDENKTDTQTPVNDLIAKAKSNPLIALIAIGLVVVLIKD